MTKSKEKTIKHEVFALFISPTHNTEKAVRALASGIAKVVSGNDYYAINLTAADSRVGDFDFAEGDIVIVGSPVYAGRVPNKLMPYYRDCVFGNGAMGIALVTYGNRAYDDALKELGAIMVTNDFDLINAFAVPAEHSFTSELATGRPNDDDLNYLFDYGVKIGTAIKEGQIRPLDLNDIPGNKPEDMAYYVPKKEDNNPASFLKAMPVTDADKCTGCGECKSICPMGCYEKSVTQPEGICIKCQGCIKACPEGAKRFDNEDFRGHQENLRSNYAKDVHEIEVFG